MAKTTKHQAKAQDVLMQKLQTLSNKLRVVTHPKVQEILTVIGEGESNVKSIYAKTGHEQSVTSSFLAQLRNQKICNTRREGKQIYYSNNPETWEKLKEIAEAL